MKRTGKTKLATLGVQGIYDAKDPSMMSELRPDKRGNSLTTQPLNPKMQRERQIRKCCLLP